MDESPLPPYSKGLTTADLQRGYVQSLQEEARMGPIWNATGWSPYTQPECSTSIKAGLIARFHHVREKVTADRIKAKADADRRRKAVHRASLRCHVSGDECGARADKCKCPACMEWLGDEAASSPT